jgi:putative tryptophan/tyrosine transport system substrate-binding protein
VVGAIFIDSASSFALPLDGFHQGLHNMGYFEGRNIAIEYRWADSQGELLPALAADLVGHHVTVIFAGGPRYERPKRNSQLFPSSSKWARRDSE